MRICKTILGFAVGFSAIVASGVASAAEKVKISSSQNAKLQSTWCRADKDGIAKNEITINQIVKLDQRDFRRLLQLKSGQSVIVDFVPQVDLASLDPFAEINTVALQICRLSDGEIVYPSKKSFFSTLNQETGVSEGLRGIVISAADDRYIINAEGALGGQSPSATTAELFVRERKLTPELPVEQLDVEKYHKEGYWEIQRQPETSALGEIFAFDAELGQVIEVSLSSIAPNAEGYDPFLQIAPPDASLEDVMINDDHDGTSSNSRHRFTVKKAGRYEIYATSGFSSFGPFTLALKKEQAKPFKAPQLKLGESKSFALSEDSDGQYLSARMSANRRYALNISANSDEMAEFMISVDLGTPISLEVQGPGSAVVTTEETTPESKISWIHSALITLSEANSFELSSTLPTTVYIRLQPFGAIGKVNVELTERK